MATNQFKWLVTPLDSEATEKPQPSKDMNGGSNKIDWANPESPSTIPGVRRADYQNFISKLNSNQKKLLWDAAMKYKGSWLTADQIMEKIIPNIQGQGGSVIDIKVPDTKKNTPTDLTIKGNFDLYNPVDWQNQPEIMQQYFAQANSDLKASTRALSKLMLQQDALGAKSSNVNQVTTLIDAVENAYDRWIFDTKTIANTLGVDENVISLIQQGKANELVTLKEEYVQEQLKPYYRAEEDYDINMARTMEDYQLAKTNLDQKYNSAMQTLKRNLFDDKRAASVGSAVAGLSGSEYAVNVIESKHQQNMDDLQNNYIYSDMTQKYSYTRAIEDYNKNITRLSEDFDDALKNIQAGILQQFQEIDNKIGLTTEQLAKAYGTLEQNVATAKSTALTNYLTALSKNENDLADRIANIYGIDTSTVWQRDVSTAYNNFMTTYKELIDKWGAIRQWRCWEPVNEYLKFLGSDLQISEANDLSKYAKDKYPTEWAIAYFDGTQSRATGQTKKHWHTWIVVSVDPQKWTVTVLDSNGSKKMWLAYSTYKLSDVTGYYTPGKQQTAETTEETATTTWYLPWYEQDYRKYLTEWTDGFTSTSQKTLISKFWSWDNFVANAKAFEPEIKKEDLSVIENWISMIDSIVSDYEEATKDMNRAEMMEAYQWLTDEDSRKQNLAAQKYPKFATAYKRFQQYIAQWYIDTIINSKKSWATYWQLSDREWSRLAAAFTPASMNLPKEEFLRLMWEAKTDLEQNAKEIKKAINTSKPKEESKGWYSLLDLFGWITQYITSLRDISNAEDLNLEENVFTGNNEFNINPFWTGSMFGTWTQWGGWTWERKTTMQ